MPLNVPSFLKKSSPTIPFLLQDVDLKGGLRVVSSESDLTDTTVIPNGAKVPGMLVVVRSNMRVYQLGEDGIFTDQGKIGSASVPQINVGPQLYLDGEGKLRIHNSYVLPQNGEVGDKLVLDSNRNPAWEPSDGSPDVGSRVVVSHALQTSINGGESERFAIPMGRSNLLIEVRIDTPQVLVEGFGDPSYAETNPYSFKSRHDQMFDDGSTLMSDGTIRYSRRYAIVSNTEKPASNQIYWQLTNHGNLPVTPTLTLTYTVVE